MSENNSANDNSWRPNANANDGQVNLNGSNGDRNDNEGVRLLGEAVWYVYFVDRYQPPSMRPISVNLDWS